MKIKFTAILPISAEIELPINFPLTFSQIQQMREKIKDQADKIFESSSVSWIITDCSIKELEE